MADRKTKMLEFLKKGGATEDEITALMKGFDGDGDDAEEADDELEKALGDIEGEIESLGARDPLGGASAAMDANEPVSMAKSLDATGFLRGLVDETGGALDGLGAHVETLTKSMETANKGLLAMGRLAVSQRDEIVELRKSLASIEERLGEPVGRKGFTGAGALKKSFHGGEGEGGEPLNKSMIVRGLEVELSKAEKGTSNFGMHDVGHAITMVESNGTIDAALMKAARENVGH